VRLVESRACTPHTGSVSSDSLGRTQNPLPWRKHDLLLWRWTLCRSSRYWTRRARVSRETEPASRRTSRPHTYTPPCRPPSLLQCFTSINVIISSVLSSRRQIVVPIPTYAISATTDLANAHRFLLPEAVGFRRFRLLPRCRSLGSCVAMLSVITSSSFCED